MTYRPVTGGRQHRTPATFPKLFTRNPVVCFLDKLCVDIFVILSAFLKIWTVVLRPGRKPHRAFFIFGSIISGHRFSRHLASTVPERLRREMPRKLVHSLLSPFCMRIRSRNREGYSEAVSPKLFCVLPNFVVLRKIGFKQMIKTKIFMYNVFCTPKL